MTPIKAQTIVFFDFRLEAAPVAHVVVALAVFSAPAVMETS
jgi:hypothetical protein